VAARRTGSRRELDRRLLLGVRARAAVGRGSWPHPSTVFVAVGGDPYLVHTGLPDVWSRLGRPTARGFEPLPDRGLALVLDDDRLSAFDAEGLAWESDHLGPDAVWLGRLDDEVHLRAGALLHRVQLRHGRTVTEPAPW
jgi:hypothetical protein